MVGRDYIEEIAFIQCNENNPYEIRKLQELQTPDLSGNQFSGEIPETQFIKFL